MTNHCRLKECYDDHQKLMKDMQSSEKKRKATDSAGLDLSLLVNNNVDIKIQCNKILTIQI